VDVAVPPSLDIEGQGARGEGQGVSKGDQGGGGGRAAPVSPDDRGDREGRVEDDPDDVEVCPDDLVLEPDEVPDQPWEIGAETGEPPFSSARVAT
jgi:hypothetical protein